MVRGHYRPRTEVLLFLQAQFRSASSPLLRPSIFDFFLRAHSSSKVLPYSKSTPPVSLPSSRQFPTIIYREARRPFIRIHTVSAAGLIKSMESPLHTFRIIPQTLGLHAGVVTLAVYWQESCQDPSLFCYRIGKEIFVRNCRANQPFLED